MWGGGGFTLGQCWVQLGQFAASAAAGEEASARTCQIGGGADVCKGPGAVRQCALRQAGAAHTQRACGGVAWGAGAVCVLRGGWGRQGGTRQWCVRLPLMVGLHVRSVRRR